MAVRFGNVLGSSGERDPEVQGADRQGRPVTVTHPDIIRYFMTIPEAARLVLQAGAIGESGQVLVLGHGRSGEDRGSGEDDDPDGGTLGAGDRDPVHRAAAGRSCMRS